jgi:hypothetical protein
MSAAQPIFQSAPYRIVSPDGRWIPVTKEVFHAYARFIEGKSCGVVEVAFKAGGIAGVIATEKTTYK